MAVVPGTSSPPPGDPLHARTSIPPCGAVPSGTVSFPQGTKKPPRYMVAEVFFPSDQGIFAWTDSLRPELPYSGSIIGMGLDGNPKDSPALARTGKKYSSRCCTAREEDDKGFLCAQEFSLEAWENC